MQIKRAMLILLAAVLCLSFACQKRSAQVDNKINPQFTVAVAPFTIASDPWELLAGYMPDHVTPPKADGMDDLDAIMAKSLKPGPERNLLMGAKVKSCMQGVSKATEANRLATLKYWQSVGKCMDAQYLLVPMIVHWKERQGSAAGSTSPAWVIMDIYMLNVKTGGLVNHFHYDYQQKALTDNILDAATFFKRKGQWVTAADLAAEGVDKALKEFGL